MHMGLHDFVVCCGYTGYLIKEYFANYFLHMSDVTFDMASNKMEVHNRYAESWKVTLVDTGELTQTGGRLKRIENHLDDTFCLTYGDGVSDININHLIKLHQQEGVRNHNFSCSASWTVWLPVYIKGNKVDKFLRKTKR